jgi:hypothetical protein
MDSLSLHLSLFHAVHAGIVRGRKRISQPNLFTKPTAPTGCQI